MTQEKLDNQRDVVKNERRLSVDNQPYGTAERMQELLWPKGHPYHHSTIGSMEDLSAASLDDVSRFFATYYAPNNAVLTVAGDFDRDAAVAAIERHFGPILANPGLPQAPGGDVPDRSAARCARWYRTRSSSRGSTSRIGFTVGTDAHEAFNVLSDLLGTGRASRPHRSLVRDQQLAADVAAFVFLGHGSTALGIWATARPEVAVESLETQLLADIEQLAVEGPSDEERPGSGPFMPPRSRRGWSRSASAPIGSASTPASSTTRRWSTPRSRASTP